MNAKLKKLVLTKKRGGKWGGSKVKRREGAGCKGRREQGGKKVGSRMERRAGAWQKGGM